MRVETIYWVENGETKVEKEKELEELDKLMELREEYGAQPIVVHEKGDEYGHFRDSILAFPHPERPHSLLVFIIREWIPAFGYSWSEVQIKRIEI
jgi:hypothetical protein